MKASDIDLRTMLRFEPGQGHILFGGERFLLFRQEAFAHLRDHLLTQLGPRLARSLLAKFGQRCGVEDYLALRTMFPWDSEWDELAAGTVMHSWSGLTRVDCDLLETDRSRGELHVRGSWKNSYEAEVHMASHGLSDEAQCHTLVGFASGWCSTFLGKPVLAVEIACVAKGDPCCRVEIRPDETWGPEADPWREALLEPDASMWRMLERKGEELEAYRQALLRMGTPILEVWEGVVVVPVLGAVDAPRSAVMMDALLERIAKSRVRCALIDMTGVEIVDEGTARHLRTMVAAAKLLGAHCVMTGLRPDAAQALVRLGAGLEGLATRRTLKEGLEESFELLGYAVV